MNTDVEWEKWGKNDPYFGVITHDKYRRTNLTNEVLLEFFESGRKHVDHVLTTCRRHLDENFSPKKALDFGCGTGRLLIPLAEIAEHVVGLDVSDSMLQEARHNCGINSIKNVSLLKSDDNLSQLNGHYDFIHSFIVFQHIPIDRGKHIFRNLINHLELGGICAIHLTYSKYEKMKSHRAPPAESCSKRSRRRRKEIPPSGCVLSSQDPEMQMNSYNVNELLFSMQSAGIHNFHVEFTNHGGPLGIFLYFRKPRKA